MAQPQARTAAAATPTLQRGRPADPVQPDPGGALPAMTEPATRTPAPADPEQTTAQDPDPGARTTPASGTASSESKDGERLFAESRQRRYRRLLRQCERVLLMDFNRLAMPDWPDNFVLASARRRRDLWLFSASLTAIIFLSGMTGFVPAWVAGGGFGAFVVIVLSGLPPIRRLYSPRPSYFELIMERQQMLRDARRHIAHLESDAGLIWQCAQMSDFNPTLRATRFSTLLELSERRRIARSLSSRGHIRLYLIYLLEAEKAYDRLQHAYFEGHQHAIDRGWQALAETPPDRVQGGPPGAADEAGRVAGEAPSRDT